MAYQPKISIVTVVYNNRAEMALTMDNVAAQTYPNIEYVVVDGASTDGTKELIEGRMAEVDKYLSEPDKGLYDAMNKGIDLATGDYIWFMNSGDRIESNTLLQDIADKFNWQHDVYYGETHLMDEQGKVLGTRSELTTRKLPEQLTWEDFKYGQLVGHQAFIVKRSICGHYNLSYPCSADQDWQIRCLKAATSVQNTGFIMCRFMLGGVSTQRQKSGLKERFAIMAHYFGTAQAVLSHVYILLRAARFKLLS